MADRDFIGAGINEDFLDKQTHDLFALCKAQVGQVPVHALCEIRELLNQLEPMMLFFFFLLNQCTFIVQFFDL